MKVLFLLDSFPKISETFILNQINGLQDLGIEIDVLASRNPEEPISHKAYGKQVLNKNLFYFDNNCSLIIRILQAFQILFKRPQKIVKYYRHPVKSRSLHDLFLTHKILNIPKNYDLVHAHFGGNGILGARLKEWKIFNGKLITSFHGYDMSIEMNKNGKHVYKILSEQGDLFLPISDFWKYKLINTGFPPEKVFVHRMGVDLNKFKQSIRKCNNKIKLLSIGRLTGKKGFLYSIQAFKILLKKINRIDLEYNIIGDGEDKDSLLRLIKNENLTYKIKILGWKTQEDIKNILYDSHIFVLPSITSQNGDMEGIPVSLMEAMATAMPVISTYHSGIPELIKDGVTGFLVPEKDVELLADKILYVINRPESWSKIGISARKFVEQNHNIQNLNKELLNIYQQLLNN